MKPLLLALIFLPLSLPAADIYTGEPLGEALFDLTRAAVPIAHELATATPLQRTDVFKLKDHRLLALTSEAKKNGQPYTIVVIQITPDAKTALTKTTPAIASLDLSSK